MLTFNKKIHEMAQRLWAKYAFWHKNSEKYRSEPMSTTRKLSKGGKYRKIYISVVKNNYLLKIVHLNNKIKK